ncbi:3'-5' exonuclease eri-1 [Dirofilaria immitis]|nr:3'-5' exonuclease eri-1 [Dirofilaria immitis]
MVPRERFKQRNFREEPQMNCLMAKSIFSAKCLSGGEELEKFYKLIIEASQKVQEMKMKNGGNSKFNEEEDNNAPYVLPMVPYKEPLMKNPKHVLHVMRRLHSMTTAEMQKELKRAHIDSRGKRNQLYSKLKKYFRKEFTIIKNVELLRNKTEIFYDYFVVMDFECTCEADLYDYNHEIIEFPAILVDVDVFHSYVQPLANPQLSEFCSCFTGITQEMVDRALPFIDVLDSFRTWMHSHHLGQKMCAMLSPWDIAKFFSNAVHSEHSTQKINLGGMLTFLNMEFEGREHSGLDDSKNIARIVIKMLEDRSELRVNEKLVRTKEVEKTKILLLNNKDRLAWKDNLPYMIQQISRDSFVSGEYLDCDTCDEND